MVNPDQPKSNWCMPQTASGCTVCERLLHNVDVKYMRVSHINSVGGELREKKGIKKSYGSIFQRL